MKRVLCFVLTFVMMTSVLMTTVLAVDTEGDIVVPETLTEEAQGDLAGTIIYGSESIRRLPMTETSRNLDTKSWTTLYSDNNWLLLQTKWEIQDLSMLELSPMIKTKRHIPL